MEWHENKLEIAHRFRYRDTDSHNRLGDHPGSCDSLSHRQGARGASGHRARAAALMTGRIYRTFKVRLGDCQAPGLLIFYGDAPWTSASFPSP